MKIVYFAWLRDKIGVDEEIVSLPAEVTDVGKLINWLTSRSQRYEQAFEFIEVVKVSVNRESADYDHAVSNDDEVVFYPPIAGG